MVNWVVGSRHWSPVQGYAPGDVLISLLHSRWAILSISPTQSETRARLHLVALKRADEIISLVVLDGPVMQDIAARFVSSSDGLARWVDSYAKTIAR